MGGVHEIGQSDFLRPYVELLMKFIGIEDLEFVTASGLNMGEEARDQGIRDAQSDILRSVKNKPNALALEEVAA